MPRLIYFTNARLPSVMAHGLQIVQNCEAFAQSGVDVRLWCARRAIPQDERGLNPDIWAYYGVQPNFRLRRLPTLDLTRFGGTDESVLARVLFYVQYGTFALAALFAALWTSADLYYSRDPLTLLLLSLVKPRRALVYEAHQLHPPGWSGWLQRHTLPRCALTVAVTPPLRDALEGLQASNTLKSQIVSAHDGIRQARFEALPSQADARARVGWSPDVFIVGYMGRLTTLGITKGVDILIDALALLPEARIAIALVGGPDAMVAAYREQWRARGLPDALFLAAGQVPPDQVPLYLSAFDICAMPFTEHFGLYASPMKLFEYMASGRALVASDLPAWRDVVQHEQTALLVPAADVPALAAAIAQLHMNMELRTRLADNARQHVLAHYTWRARAERILQLHKSG
ncbi:MAG: glycosyltransferase family 4 protein [Armatimonadetes bacterium]|nr:glycosyltransferase family 4 protein [Anaerolineae bacterium]